MIDDEDDDIFARAAAWLSTAPTAGNLSTEAKLEIYGLYKYAIDGAGPDTPRPSIFTPASRAKYDAWKFQSSKHDVDSAKQRYVEIAKDVGWDDTKVNKGFTGGVKVSTMALEETVAGSALNDAVVENDVTAVKTALTSTDVNEADDYGLTALHLAADRGLVEVAQLLINAGADIGRQDQDGQTPRMLAEAAGRHDVIPLL